MATILWMIDVGPWAAEGLPRVVAWARGLGAAVRICHATGLPPRLRAPKGEHIEPGDSAAERERVALAREYLGRLREKLEAEGISVKVVVQGGHPEDVAAEWVRAEAVELVVAGRTRLHGIDRLLLGSTTRRIIRAVSGSTLVLGEGAGPLSTLLCPVEVEDPEEEAHILLVAEWARRLGVAVRWLGVEEGRSSRLGSEDLEVRLCRKVEGALGRRLPAEHRIQAIVAESAIAGILAQAEGVELIALRHSGRRGLARLLAGDVSERVVAKCPLSVLVSH
jgi:nucleotide-binding universal stress UspA family protein